MKKIIKNKYFLTTILAILVYLIYLCIMKIVPFGEFSILKCDLYQQYVNFFCYLKDCLLNGKSLMFSWNLGLGNNFFTTFAYYLASPLNIIVVFFNSSNMDIAIEILTLIKIILIANSAVFYLSKIYNYEKKSIILFGIIYAYSSFVICYGFHIMWLDCIYMLPIVLYFIDKYIDGGKIYPVIIAIAYGLWTNYYLGFINAFVAGIYFIVRYIIKKDIMKKGEIKKFIKKLVIIILAIILAFGIIMILFIPSIKQLSNNMHVENTKIYNLEKEKLVALTNVIFNNYVYDYAQQAGLIFSSTIVIALIPLYYFNENITKKEKILFTLMLIFLLLPIVSPLLNKIWHGFTTPNCFYYRFSYATIFVIIIMAFREYQNLEKTKKWHYLFSILVFVILTVAEIMMNRLGYFSQSSFEISNADIIISTIIYMLMITSLFMINAITNNKYKNIITIILVAITIIDLIVGAKNGQENNDKYFKREHFTQYNSIMEEVNKKIDKPETERIIFTQDVYGSNMSMRFGYSNIGYFTSARNKDTIKAMYNLGYNVQRADGLWMTSFSGTYFNYSLAGVKYYVSKEKLEKNEIYGFEFQEEYNGYYIYSNKNAFDVGFYLKDNVDVKDKNPFEVQNDYLNKLNSKSTNEKYFEDIENTDAVQCTKIIEDNSEDKKIKYQVKANDDTNLYVFSNNNLQIIIDGKEKFQDYASLWTTESGIKGIKHLNKGEIFEFEVSTKYPLDEMFIYASKNEKIQEVLNNKEEKGTFKTDEILSNGLKGKAEFKEDGYLTFNISYDSGWHVFVDGKEKNVEAISDVFVGVELEKGEHEIYMYYEAPGYKLGRNITICSIILIIIIIVFEEKNKKMYLEANNER